MATSNTRLSTNPLVSSVQQFIRMEASGGILLLACAILALVWANSPWSASYFELWATKVSVGFGAFKIDKALSLWINDGLMAIFFFVVGLEIKREILVGELSSPKKAGLALAGALGGMIVPAIMYLLFNLNGEGGNGWGIPMATDIAFALGVLALLGKRAPLSLKIFLTALAIVDDLGAVLVIALFYTANVSANYLLMGFGLLVALVIGSRLGVRRTSFFVFLGILLWIAFLKSGVHATVAGVLLALTIPARRVIDMPSFVSQARELLDRFATNVQPGKTQPTADQLDSLNALETTIEHIDTPLHRMEHALHGWVAFFIMPVFALANAGVVLGAGTSVMNPITLGIIVGLFVGKGIGITLFSWIAVKLGIAELPENITWRQIQGVSILCGIGFTMSLFIAGLAFEDRILLDNAKVGILVGSVVAGVVGSIVLTMASKKARATA